MKASESEAPKLVRDTGASLAVKFKQNSLALRGTIRAVEETGCIEFHRHVAS